ncbi:MAG: hypothetical protein R3F41_05010 [Gammaproteobacteria bacterium]|nr:hypothetical protein [Pseudomonadales bacterium]
MKLFRASITTLAAMFTLVVSLFWLFGIGSQLQTVAALSAALVAGIVLPPIFLLWGLPIHFIFRRFNLNNLAWYATAGALPGAPFVTIFTPFGNDPLSAQIWNSMLFSYIGAAGAVLFWFLTVRNDASIFFAD